MRKQLAWILSAILILGLPSGGGNSGNTSGGDQPSGQSEPQAPAAAQYGNADLILVHAKSQEEAFVEAGYSYVLTDKATFLTFQANGGIMD